MLHIYMMRGTVFCVGALSYMTTKICLRCKEDKPINRYDYYRKYNGERDLKPTCKDCFNAYLRNKRVQDIDYTPLPSLPNEFWCIFPNDTRYSVSSIGRVKANINIGYRHKEIIVKQQTTKKGYLSVMMNKKRYQVHQAVAITFIPNPNNYPQINHINCNKKDNKIENLEWCNNSINIKHAWDNGLIPRNRKK